MENFQMPGLFIAPHTNWFSSPYSVSFETTEQNDNLKKNGKNGPVPIIFFRVPDISKGSLSE